MRVVSSPGILIVLVRLSISATAQINKVGRSTIRTPHQLYKGDLAHISDDHFGRMDVEAVTADFIPRHDRVRKWRALRLGIGHSKAHETARPGYLLPSPPDAGSPF